ncbi:peptide-methionine (S)-S-oxide reductase [Thiothrix nivea]|uniref:peptide-methionine (S)-S-oxide reductase n=1 Tax=Thiothrix nivea (strain ATCC 35100 / DSM 5205 / JP2) TaxID=870187 RepID=A0A656HJN3_THINJ|nr:Methionine sulfoxide reductase A [Thiothrix nivea DSM 5205]
MEPSTHLQQIGFGGGCYWCTEAVFQTLRGVQAVKQGFIASDGDNQSLSEAVVVEFAPDVISLHDLVEVHLHTHSSTSSHQLRDRYRSAIYVFNRQQEEAALAALRVLQQDFDQPIITRVLPFVRFKASEERYQDYFLNNPDRPFCQTYISPKVRKLRARFARLVLE